jgi:hypothetical protein
MTSARVHPSTTGSRRHAIGVVVLAAAGACGDPPPLAIKYALTPGPTQACMDSKMQLATSCSDVAVPCAAHIGIRIVLPDDPSRAFVSVCQPLPATGRMDLCSIAGVDLPAGVSIPEQTLQIQVAVYADADLAKDSDGNFLCPADPQFSPDGLPVSAIPVGGDPPIAVGGSAYYHPGDSETTVALGCTKQDELAACISEDALLVSATVNDFDLPDLAVSATVANSLTLLVGEPVSTNISGEYVLNPSATIPLQRTQTQPSAWSVPINMPTFTSAACLEVLEDSQEITPYLTCKSFMPGQKTLDFTGIRVSQTTHDQVLAAMGLSRIPINGLVLGITVDNAGAPLAGMNVVPTSGTVEYLTADRKALQTGTTSVAGIFLSTDATFGTSFTAHGASMLQTSLPGFGGVVDGKVTVVVLQLPPGT